MSKTVRVRIAVASWPDGGWVIPGQGASPNAPYQSPYQNALAAGGVWHFIEADIPLPEPQTIEGEVVS